MVPTAKAAALPGDCIDGVVITSDPRPSAPVGMSSPMMIVFSSGTRPLQPSFFSASSADLDQLPVLEKLRIPRQTLPCKSLPTPTRQCEHAVKVKGSGCSAAPRAPGTRRRADSATTVPAALDAFRVTDVDVATTSRTSPPLKNGPGPYLPSLSAGKGSGSGIDTTRVARRQPIAHGPANRKTFAGD